jgi:hypothetical protein
MTLLALHPEPPSHHARKLVGNGRNESGQPVFARRGTTDVAEGLENVPLFVGWYPDASVSDRAVHQTIVSRARCGLDIHLV